MSSLDVGGAFMLGAACGLAVGVVIGASLALAASIDKAGILQKEAVAHGYAEVVTTGGEKVFIWKEKE
jgi:hypothetical protein